MLKKNINEIYELWKQEKKQYIKISSFASYNLLLENHIKPYFGKLYDVEQKDVQDFIFKKLNDGLSQKTVRDITVVLKMILRFAYKNEFLSYQELEYKFPTNTESKKIEVLSIENQKKLMRYIEDNFSFKNLGILIALCTGIRIGEVCALKWNDIDINEGLVRINKTVQRIYIIEGNKRYSKIIIDTPKTRNSIREIPLTSYLKRTLKPLKKVVNDNYYVLTNSNKPTEPRTYRNYYKRLLKRIKIPQIGFHGLRHSFATRCIESKCDYKTVSTLLGHSNITTTLNLYVHPNFEQKKKALDEMNKKLQ